MNSKLLSKLDYITLAAFIGIPLVSGADVMYRELISDNKQIVKANNNISSNPFEGPTSEELMAGLIAEGYQPAIDLQWKWDHPDIRRLTKENELRLLPRDLEDKNPYELRFPLSPKYAALSDMLSMAEGTKRQYNIMLGGHLFHDYTSHPKLTGEMKSRGTAAGKHQVLVSTFLQAQKKGFFVDFSPYEQDRWFFDKVKRLGVNEKLLDRALESKHYFRRVLHKMSSTWSPMPQMDGTGRYAGQNPKPVKVHYKRFKNFLLKHSNND
tara:strand:- start:44156 stop:44956 length:801 start_codon:yes stop_codon:yes gene_type:complete